MQEWQERVVAERDDLCAKLAKLRQFKNTVEYAMAPVKARQLLDQQENMMQNYADILGARIDLFK